MHAPLDRAPAVTLNGLFANVRRNYFSYYFNYMYFNVARIMYLQLSVLVIYVALGPSVLVGAITLGLFQRVIDAFSQVLSSFQYLVTSWSTIIELQSIQKRLVSFEAVLHEKALPGIEATAGP